MWFLRALVRHERREATVPPHALFGNLAGRRRSPPGSARALPLLIIPDRGGRQVRHVASEPGNVTLAIISNAAGSVELDRLERSHESPAQSKPVGDGVVEIFGAHVTLLHKAKRLREERNLQPIEDEAVDLALHVD